jgi:DNA-binding transcriptional MerR regulator
LSELDRPLFSIGAVSRMLGVAPSTLRTWEERYAVVAPKRSAGGHRLYSRADLSDLRFVTERLREGLQPSDAHRLLAEQIERRTRA